MLGTKKGSPGKLIQGAYCLSQIDMSDYRVNPCVGSSMLLEYLLYTCMDCIQHLSYKKTKHNKIINICQAFICLNNLYYPSFISLCMIYTMFDKYRLCIIWSKEL